jgi:REP element-mobilizing transposase RayT
MQGKYKNRYRIESHRMPRWDYSGDGVYFITVVIQNRKSISSFIGGYKSAINSKIDDYIDENNLNMPKYNRNNHFFQPNYYDHLIRNNTECQRIKQYIINNPINWDIDRFYE